LDLKYVDCIDSGDVMLMPGGLGNYLLLFIFILSHVSFREN